MSEHIHNWRDVAAATELENNTPDLSQVPPPLTDNDMCGLSPYIRTPLKEVPVSYFEWMVLQTQYASRVSRSPQWHRVMDWIRRR
jgi:hypothetical protein